MRATARIAAASAMLGAVLVAGPGAAARTCSFAGPTPGFRAVEVNLPNGSEFATIHLTAMRPAMPAGDRSSWHLAAGFAIIDAQTHEIVSSRIFSAGSSTRRIVVEQDGMDVARQDITGPDATFVHQAWVPVNRLAPGTYYLIGFGTDSDARLPNPWWGADISLGPDVACTAIGTGETFDIDQTDFTHGTQVSASVAGMADNARQTFHTDRHLVFGLMDAATQLAGSASLDYTMPGGASGSVSQRIVPFVSAGGDFAYTANFLGPFPLIDIAGVALDLP